MEDKRNKIDELNIRTNENLGDNLNNSEDLEKVEFINTIDIKKINHIKKLEKKIISENFSIKKMFDKNTKLNIIEFNNNSSNILNKEKDFFDTYNSFQNREQKLMKHANFYHNFSEYDVSVLDIIPVYFIKDKFALETGIENNK